MLSANRAGENCSGDQRDYYVNRVSGQNNLWPTCYHFYSRRPNVHMVAGLGPWGYNYDIVNKLVVH